MAVGVGGADCHALPVGSGGLLVGTNLALHAAVAYGKKIPFGPSNQ